VLLGDVLEGLPCNKPQKNPALMSGVFLSKFLFVDADD
jgi:hypothetical protein